MLAWPFVFEMGNVMSIDDVIFFVDSAIEHCKGKTYGYFKINREYWLLYAYRHWALKEIRKMLLESPDSNYIWLLEIFKDTMDEYACKAVDHETSMMFSTACDTAIEVLDWMIVCERV